MTTTAAVNDAVAGDGASPPPNAVFTAAELDLVARALDARAQIYARVAGRAATVPDYEIAARAARRHRALAKRARAARNSRAPRTHHRPDRPADRRADPRVRTHDETSPAGQCAEPGP